MNPAPVDQSVAGPEACLVLFSKPAQPGRVKTRLIGAISAEQAAALHAAFLGDLCARLAGSDAFALRLAWALADGEVLPAVDPGELPAMRQQGADLGARLFAALAAAGDSHALVGAVGSDHPALSARRVEEAFAALRAGAQVALGPASDGGYYLVAVRREALAPRLFEEIPWSTGEVLARTLERCAELRLRVALLAEEADVDTPADLERLAAELAAGATAPCPRTAALLATWGMLSPPLAAAAT